MGYAGGAVAGAAAAAAMANAIKASGTIIQVNPDDFLKILSKSKEPLVVMADKTFWSGYKYLTSYKELAFYAKSSERLNLPGDAEIIVARKIWIPS
jgi:hypothetical protein